MTVFVSDKFARVFLKELFNQETRAREKKESTKTLIRKIGRVVFNHYKKSGVIDLYVGMDEEENINSSSAYICNFTDGSYGIVIKDTHILFENKELTPALMGCLAHEVGHFINGDLDINDEDELFVLRGIDNNSDKHALLAKNSNVNAYVRSVVTSILRGGVIRNELAADMVAVELCGLPNLLLAKQLDDSETENLMVLIEKRNRNNRLLGLVKDGSLVYRDDSFINIIPPNNTLAADSGALQFH